MDRKHQRKKMLLLIFLGSALTLGLAQTYCLSRSIESRGEEESRISERSEERNLPSEMELLVSDPNLANPQDDKSKLFCDFFFNQQFRSLFACISAAAENALRSAIAKTQLTLHGLSPKPICASLATVVLRQ